MNELPKKIMNKYEIAHKVWILQVPFCAMRYINSAMYVPEGTVLETECLRKQKKSKIESLLGRYPSLTEDLSNIFELLLFKRYVTLLSTRSCYGIS